MNTYLDVWQLDPKVKYVTLHMSRNIHNELDESRSLCVDAFEGHVNDHVGDHVRGLYWSIFDYRRNIHEDPQLRNPYPKVPNPGPLRYIPPWVGMLWPHEWACERP